MHVSFKGSILGISGKFLGDLENGVGGWHEASHTVTKFVSSLSLTENVQERIRTDTSPNGPGLVDCTFALLPWQNGKEVRDVWESCETGIRPRNMMFCCETIRRSEKGNTCLQLILLTLGPCAV